MKDKTYLIHIIESINYINDYVKGGEESLKDHKTYDAVLRQLQIMSESTQHLSKTIKAKHINIRWREISGFRNILVHDYLGDLDGKIIWSIISNKLPELKSAIELELSNFKN